MWVVSAHYRRRVLADGEPGASCTYKWGSASGVGVAVQVAQRTRTRAWSSVFSSSAKEQSVRAPPSRTIASRFTAHSESETNAHAE